MDRYPNKRGMVRGTGGKFVKATGIDSQSEVR